ncbi:hypothetical protein Tsubulata_040564, partial [Turnera subulata]
FGDVIPFLENKNVLVTAGATGFLAKIFVEKILRVQPNIQKIYLLLRAADDKSASQRLQNEVIEKDLFRVLKEEWGSNFNSFITQKIVLVPGDISLGEDFGVKEPKLRQEMWSQLDVLVNLAATTNFDERYDVALGTNTMGAQHVEGLIPEAPYTFKDSLNGVSGLDINEEKLIVQKKLNELETEEATDESITEAMKDLGLKRLKFFFVNAKGVVDVIPADMVVNGMLVAMVAHANQPSLSIYHTGSSKRNPITYREFRDYKFTYFKRRPWIGKNGEPVKVGRRMKMLGSTSIFHTYMFFRYSLKLKALALTSSAFGKNSHSKYGDLKRKVNFMMRLMKLYKPYLFFGGIFDDQNTGKLQMAAQKNSEEEAHLFYFDPQAIDWEDYFLNAHFPGVIVGKELFRVLKENWSSDFNSFISEKIVLVPGDISLDENLGVKNPNLREEMWSQLDVIINLAATTNFDERYDIALGINTFGAKNVVCFAKKCARLEKAGLIPEAPYTFRDTLHGVSGLDIDEEKKVVQQKLNELKTGETTTAELITEAMKDLGIKRLSFFLADPNGVPDLIPADMVVNTMLVAMVAHANQRPSQTIYHIGSSKRNPMTYRNFGDYGFTYFTGKPWIGKDGKPVKVGWPRIMGSLTIFHIYVAFRYLLLLQALAFANLAFGNYFHGIYSDLKRKVNFMMRLLELYMPYLFFHGVFDDKNTEKLRRAAQKNSKDSHLFYFDPKTINWEDYFLNAHFPGVVKNIGK